MTCFTRLDIAFSFKSPVSMRKTKRQREGVTAHYQVSSRCCSLYSLPDLVSQTPSRLPWQEFSHVAINARKIFTHKYTPLFVVRYSISKLNELEQCRVKESAHVFDMTATDLNPGSLDKEHTALATAPVV